MLNKPNKILWKNPLLESLNQSLFEDVSKTLPETKKALLQAKWMQIRDVAVQNSGFSKWGSHLLKLDEQKLQQLRWTFHETIHSIEDGHLHLEQSFIEQHPELIALRFLLDQRSDDYLKLFNIENAKAIFWEYAPELVARHRSHFQEVFKFLLHHPKWQQRSPVIAEMLIGNLIALLPYFDFEDKSRIEILRRMNNIWRLVTYQITHIPLIEGEIDAYGLEPVEGSQHAWPILIFRGTPYPAAQGFLEAVLSDLHPIKSIGQEIFEKGQPALNLWIESKIYVDCYGLSLGGALAYHAGNAYGEKVKVHAYASPGLIPMKGGLSKIHGQVFFHHQDLIKSLGYHPESDNFSVFSVLTQSDQNILSAHACPAGIEPTLVLKVNPSYENQTWTRYFANILKVIVSTQLFVILFPIKLFLSFVKKVRSLGNPQ